MRPELVNNGEESPEILPFEFEEEPGKTVKEHDTTEELERLPESVIAEKIDKELKRISKEPNVDSIAMEIPDEDVKDEE